MQHLPIKADFKMIYLLCRSWLPKLKQLWKLKRKRENILKKNWPTLWCEVSKKNRNISKISFKYRTKSKICTKKWPWRMLTYKKRIVKFCSKKQILLRKKPMWIWVEGMWNSYNLKTVLILILRDSKMMKIQKPRDSTIKCYSWG